MKRICRILYDAALLGLLFAALPAALAYYRIDCIRRRRRLNRKDQIASSGPVCLFGPGGDYRRPWNGGAK